MMCSDHGDPARPLLANLLAQGRSHFVRVSASPSSDGSWDVKAAAIGADGAEIHAAKVC